jgi:transposase
MLVMQAYRYALDLTPGSSVWSPRMRRTAHPGAGLDVARSAPHLERGQGSGGTVVAAVFEGGFNTGLGALARGLKAWADSRAGKRAGRAVGFPRFKARRRTTPNVRFTTGAIRVEPDRPQSVVGVDVGIKHLAVLSTGELITNPRHLTCAQARMRTSGPALSRKSGPDRRTGRRASRRWERAAARPGRAHARVTHLRRDGLHKLTSRLAATFGTIVVEDLNVAGMLRNRRPARRRRRLRRNPPPTDLQDGVG